MGAGTSSEARWDETPAAPRQGVGAAVGRGQVRDRGRGGGQGKGVGGAGARTEGGAEAGAGAEPGPGQGAWAGPNSTWEARSARRSGPAPRPSSISSQRSVPGWKAEVQAVMALRAAVFDLDGVLALPSLASSWDRAEEELALPR